MIFTALSSSFLSFRAALLAGESNDTVRYIRRRKIGQKRRSILVKRRTALHSQKIESTLPDVDDQHSQEYISRRRLIPPIEEEKQEVISAPNSPKLAFKQLKLDQFLKIVKKTNEDETLERKFSFVLEINLETFWISQ